MQSHLQKRIEEHIDTQKKLYADQHLLIKIEGITEVCLKALKAKGRIFFCGNGGSAADAQHLAAELSGRYYYDRPPLDAEALNVNMSYITAVGNDYGYDAVFARSLQAKGRKGDVLFGLSTSGNSKNVLAAIKLAKAMGITSIAFTGAHGGLLKDHAEWWIPAPSIDTPRVQETHMLIGHIICELIESNLFPKP